MIIRASVPLVLRSGYPVMRFNDLLHDLVRSRYVEAIARFTMYSIVALLTKAASLCVSMEITHTGSARVGTIGNSVLVALIKTGIYALDSLR